MGAIKRQNDTIKAQEAYRAVKRMCDSVEARIASHGADGLPEWLVERGYDLANMSQKTAILMLVNRLLGKEARDKCRDVLPCF